MRTGLTLLTFGVAVSLKPPKVSFATLYFSLTVFPWRIEKDDRVTS